MFIGSSNDPLQTFNAPNQFAAAQFGTPLRLNDILQGGPTPPGSPVCTWINGDYGDGKGRNYLEGGISAQFVFRKSARYPLIVTIPVDMAAGDYQGCSNMHFGYITTGVNVGVPLSFVPGRYGRWIAGPTAEICYYGTTTTEFVRSIGLHLPKVGASLSVEF
jgi:hypothetical protein